MDCLHNLEAEKALLGAAINDALVAQEVASLPDELFTTPLTQATHRAVKRLTAAGKVPDLVTLDAEVQCDFSDTAALIEMQQAGWSVAQAGQHEALLMEAMRRRKLCELAERILHDAPNPGASLTALEAESLTALQAPDSAAESASMEDAALALAKELDSGAKGRTQTGVADYDLLTGGVKGGQLIYLGARPGIGKTALGLAMAAHVAAHSGPVLLVSLEMGEAEIAARLMAAQSGVDLDKLSTGRMQPEDYDAIAPHYGSISALPMRISRRARTPLQIRREAVRMQARGGLKMIVVDYVQLMSGDGRGKSRYEEITSISRELKLLAMDLDVPILAMCQLNRQSEGIQGRVKKTEPSMAEARDSGALEQDANVFLTLYEPEEPEQQGEAWQLYHLCQANGMAWQVLKVEKNRQGRTGRLNVAFDKAHMRYVSISTGQEPRETAQNAPF